MRYWLMKSEPSEVSIDDLAAAPGQSVAWFGVRNYLARNYMRDQMRVGDGVLFYHSSCADPGVAGICQVSKPAYPDETQFDPDSRYFDPKASQDQIYAVLEPARQRFDELSEDEKIDFRGQLKDYVRLYAFLSQILPLPTPIWKSFTSLVAICAGSCRLILMSCRVKSSRKSIWSHTVFSRPQAGRSN